MLTNTTAVKFLHIIHYTTIIHLLEKLKYKKIKTIKM